MRHVLLLALCLLPLPVQANDGFGGLSATGLTFSQTDAVALETEDLFISPDRIGVTYQFRNLTDADVTGEVVFPLPPISLASLMYADFNLPADPDQADLVAFTAEVDGRSVQTRIDRQAVIEPQVEEGRAPALQYDTPGRDVTADLAAWDIPLTLDLDRVTARLLALSPAEREAVAAAGLAEYFSAQPGAGPEEVTPLWSLVTRYHWTQTFPAGARITIAHGYENHAPGGLFVWRHPPEEGWAKEMAARFCVDEATSKGIEKRLSQSDMAEPIGTAFYIDYVLRTANSWAGPIGRFRLTLDKGSDRNLVSLCADGIKKTDPTTFVWEKRDFTPERDLSILLVQPMPE